MLFLLPENKLHNTSHTASLSTAALGEVTVCLCPQDGWTALHLAGEGVMCSEWSIALSLPIESVRYVYK